MTGGVSYAGGGIEVSELGNDIGIKTLVRVGQNDEFLKREASLKSKISEVEEELELMKRSFEDFQRKYSVEVRNTNPIYLKLEDAIYSKNQELEKLILTKIDMDRCRERFENAKVMVHRNIYEGCTVEIGGAIWKAKNMSRVILQKDGDRVSVTN